MLSVLISIGSFFVIALCLWIILLVLMQKPSANSGMGASLGGGVAESAFGGEASKVLTRWTVYGVVAFFIGTMTLTLAQLYRHKNTDESRELSPISVQTEAAGSLTNTGNAQLPQEEAAK